MMLISRADFKVLLVDDEEGIRDTVSKSLSILGFPRLTLLSRGTEAISRFARERFDLVITDYDMPDVKGDRVAAAALESDPDQAVVLISGSLTDDEFQALSKLGVRECIRKPFRMQTLTAVAEGVLADIEGKLLKKGDLAALHEAAEANWSESDLRLEEQRILLEEALESGRQIGLSYRDLWLVAAAFLARDLERRHRFLTLGSGEMDRLRRHIESSPETVVHANRLNKILRVSGLPN